ncbi:MAG: hypothetical protein NTX09_17620 [Verrucomicrobia bacterium]|nr:hypothetical protein [Verrucomicrobiota bacterium]
MSLLNHGLHFPWYPLLRTLYASGHKRPMGMNESKELPHFPLPINLLHGLAAVPA